MIFLLFLIPICLSLLAIFYFDLPLMFFLNENVSPCVLKVATYITQLASLKLIVFFNFALLLFFYKKNKQKLSLFYATIFAQASSAAAVKILKCLFGRARPYYFLENSLTKTFFFLRWDENFSSFPSGHSAGIWAFIISMIFLFRNNKYNKLFLLLGVLIPITRLLLQMHFLSDVLMGATISSLIAIVILKGYLAFYQNKSILK
jgi:membrane-associated phospholipid phosphatase